MIITYNKDELALLCSVLSKNHIGCVSVSREELVYRLTENKSGAYIEIQYADGLRMIDMMLSLSHKTVYRITDSLSRTYTALLLSCEGDKILIIGPYLASPLSDEKIAELKKTEAAKKQRRLTEYFSSLPVVPPSSPFTSLLNTFCERMWDTQNFNYRDMFCGGASVEMPVVSFSREHEIIDTMINMKAMERRYAFENEIMQAVTQGRIQLEKKLSTTFSGDYFESRAADPLRNAKNYSVIMNTLLRKAAEQGGVHPLYLDRISSEFAARIDSMPTLNYCKELMCDMFRSYCRLVRKYSVQKYSPVVQKAVLIIDADLSACLSTGAIARAQGISTGYLSSAFKREIGESLSEYVQRKRIGYASHLLQTTDEEIQSVAQMCGIMDTQYFSKLFKKYKGITPTEYRVKSRG